MNLSEVEKINKCTRMKIPETSANVGAYYGNEENGQWQPNGVIIDSGVGGGVVGSGDAGIHRPPVYPVHMPRAQVPAGYVMAGAYYPPAPFAVPAAPQDDFADYMWMEHEEEFDKQVMQQLEEEALMEQCIEAMLEDEQRERNSRPVANGHKQNATSSNGAPSLSLEETVSRSTLNPLAAEFVPTRVRPTSTEDEKPDPPETTQEQKVVDTPETDSRLESTEEIKTEEPVQPQKDPPEVSAADIQPITEKPLDKRPKDPKKDSRPKPDTKKSQSLKPEVKAKAKPQTIKSETKVQPKKKEIKVVKSEARVEEKKEVREEKKEVKEENLEEVAPCAVEEVKPQSPQIEDPSIPKPINYAAAAKANKPKKPSTPPATDKTTPPPAVQAPAQATKTKALDKSKKPEKTVKPDKVNVQRKNSTK